MSFLTVGDRAAGAIKSGGTTRRAAKMVVLDVDHPDIEEFIETKVSEEDRTRYLKDLDSLRRFKQLLTGDHLLFVKSVNEKYMETLVDGKLVTVNATTFDNDIQVITLGTVAMRETFDFVHCMPWMDLYSSKLHISKKQYNLIKKKHLIKNPDCSLSLSDKRMSKYVNKGWRFPPQE